MTMDRLPIALLTAVFCSSGGMRYCAVHETFVSSKRCGQGVADLEKYIACEPNQVIDGPMDAIMVSVPLKEQGCLRKVVLQRDPDVAPCISYIHWHDTTYYACLLGNYHVLEPPVAPVLKSLHGCDYVLYVHRNQRIVVPVDLEPDNE